MPIPEEQNTDDETIGYEINGPGRAYFDNVVIDNILDALMELSAVTWTVRDRQYVLEKVLAEKGIDVTELVEKHVPSDEELAARTAERDEWANRIFRSFMRRPMPGHAKDPDAPSLREIKE